MAGGDGRLDLIRTRPPAPQRGLQDSDALADLRRVPQRTVLVLQRHQVAASVQPRGAARVVQQHQRQQAGRLRFVGHQPGQHPGQPDRLGAEILPDQVRPGRGRITLVEQQVEHAEHAWRAFRQQVRRGDPVRDPRVLDLLLGPDQPLGHRRLAGQERPGDLRRGQPGQRAQGQRDPGLERQRRVAAGEHQPQPVVGNAAVVGLGLVGCGIGRQGHGGDLPEFGGSDRLPAQHVDGAVTGGRGQPRARPAGDAVFRPPLQGHRERVLRAFLGEVPVAGGPDQRRDDPAPLVPERGVHRRLDVSAHHAPPQPRRTGRLGKDRARPRTAHDHGPRTTTVTALLLTACRQNALLSPGPP